jgi:hypothetical protein
MSFLKKKKEIKPSPEPKDKESIPGQENEVLIVKSQPLQSQDLAISSKPLIPQNPPREEEIPPLESPDLFSANSRDSLDFQIHKRPSREYNSNPHEKGSLRKHPHSH